MLIHAASEDEAVGKAKRMVARLDLSGVNRVEVTRTNDIIVYSFPFFTNDAARQTGTFAR